jgi:ELWxxDGT repeat protein
VERLEPRALLAAFVVKDIGPGIRTAQPFYLTVAGDTVFFVAEDGRTGRELYKTDGTAAGTGMVKEIRPGSLQPNIRSLTALNGAVLFGAEDGVHGGELWRSDGTAAGTSMLAELAPGPGGSWPDEFTAAGPLVYFVGAWDVGGQYTYFLYRTDGTAAGTRPVLSLPRFQSTVPFRAFAGTPGGRLYFAAGTADAGLELWTSDGTPEGTRLVKDIWPGPGGSGPGSSDPSLLATFGERCFFRADNGVSGIEPWVSDGTEAGTFLLKDIRPGPSWSLPLAPLAFKGKMFFGAGTELWSTDGTAAGTARVSDTRPQGGSVSLLGAAGDTLFVRAQDILYRTDGIAPATLLKDVAMVGPAAVGNMLYFMGYLFQDPHGSELWRSDGTPEGTVLVQDCFPGPQGSGPDFLTAANRGLYFTATHPQLNEEVWRLSPPAASAGGPYTVVSGRLTALDGSASTDPDPAETLTFAWDLDSDGVFGETGVNASRGDETGPNPVFSATGLAPGQAVTVTLRVTSFAGLSGTASAVVNITAPPTSPVVTAGSFDPASAPALRFTFDRDVSGELLPAGLTVRDRTTGAALSPWDFSYDPATRTATFRLPAGLPNGDYRAILAASATAGGSGVPMASDYVLDFFVLTGDITRDRSVNGTDFAILAGNFGKGGMTYAQGDLNGDGSVNGSDFALLAGNFGRTLPAPPAPPAGAGLLAASTAPAAKPRGDRGAVKSRSPLRPKRSRGRVLLASRAPATLSPFEP